ncbi:hypothetical protein O3G_MSEX007407 [Manduca sexta]|nr:hypothetical protein O3G_MSEX007407 [Manduca sexta]KAG6451966.1 hypothetical protein O3G_MSEX007407 [Manduca sexta]KAG6451967.1 hypothetical protein O3G_MSEX007407 [Manduca sexta]
MANVSLPEIAKEKETFQDAWPCIIDSLVTNPKFAQLPELASWVKKVLEYNLKGGKKIRGVTTVLAHELLEKPENVTDETMRLARIAGWCLEMLQSYMTMNDDIMDGSSTRRGMPCWYRIPDVGLGAINDAILVNCSIFEVLKMHFGNTIYYPEIVEIFNEALLYTSMGQRLDFMMAHNSMKDYSLFTIERYDSIVKYKTSYYTFKLPISLGLMLRKNGNKAHHKDIENICFGIGKLFQMQDDYIDCFGDESVTGKAGTDIQEGKCSWLAVHALQRCNNEQRAIFIQNYGAKEPEKVERIKQLYQQLQIPEVYRKEENDIYNSILEEIHALPSEIPPAIFYKVLDVIYKRTF